MKKLINQLGVGETFNLNAMAKVEELANHEMIYIYHHIKKGSILELNFHEQTLSGDLRYSVEYQGFKLGFVRVSGIMKSFYGDQLSLKAEVTNYTKDQYMPFKELDIQLGVNALKKVG